MNRETRKRRTSDFASSSNEQSRKTPMKTGKKEVQGVKSLSSKENYNDQKELGVTKSMIPNSVTYNFHHSLGHLNGTTISKYHKTVLTNQIKRFGLFSLLSPFDRRVTAITWHPKYPQVFIAGSKGGDLILHNLNGTADMFFSGIGAGGSVLAIKCSDKNPSTIYTASLTGKICSLDFVKNKLNVLLDVDVSSVDIWSTSLDICYNRELLLSGDSSGKCYLMTTSGDLIWKQIKMHSSKVSHCEFNMHDPNIFVTASIDHTVKLWDLRSISNSTSNLKPLMVFPHLKGVNSAYFSPSNGLNLLTTDQHSQLRVYSSPYWNETMYIKHPHRQFQHLTPIKAVWHPMEDIIIVGRYPDNNIQPNDARTIDFYDGSNGQLLHNIVSPTTNVVSLNAMNSTGCHLATSAGCNVVIFRDENMLKGISSNYKSHTELKNTDTDIKQPKKRTKTLSKTAEKIGSKKSSSKST